MGDDNTILIFCLLIVSKEAQIKEIILRRQYTVYCTHGELRHAARQPL
jgi:hypothetical protein